MELGKFEVSGVNAQIVYRKRIPRGIVGATVEIRYTDPIWDSLTKTVVFRGSCVKDVMNPGAVVQVPAEVVADAGCLLQVGVYGVDAENNLVIPTLWADLGYIESSADPSGDETSDPQLPVWAQLGAKIDEQQEQIEKLKGSGSGVYILKDGETLDDVPEHVHVVIDPSGESEEPPVTSVNGQTGDVVIEIPKGFSGSWKDLSDKPDIPTDEHINGLINAALGVIENGTY